MILATKPRHELERQAALESFDVHDSEPERAYDDIVLAASQICGTPQALMGLVDGRRDRPAGDRAVRSQNRRRRRRPQAQAPRRNL